MTMPQPIDDLADAVRALADPETSGAVLAQIAQKHPDLGESVARHPQVYPGLLAWLAEYGSPAPVDEPHSPSDAAYLTGGAPAVAAASAAAFAPLTSQPTPANPAGRSRTRPIVAGVLGAAAAVAVLTFVFIRGNDVSPTASTPSPGAASPTAVDAGITSTPAPTATTTPSPAASPASPTPESTPTAATEPTSTPTPTPTPTPSATDERTLNDEVYCGFTGTVVAVGYTDRFEAIICDDADGLVYIGTNLETGSTIRLPASAANAGYDANNGAIAYSLTSSRLLVTGDSGVLVDEAVSSWQIW